MRIPVVCLLLLGACSSFDLVEFPTAAMAAAVGQSSEQVVICERMPAVAAAPYAVLLCDFSRDGLAAHCNAIREQLRTRDLHPDFVVYVPAGSVYAGNVDNLRVSGNLVVGSSSPVYRPQVHAVLFRLLPWRVGANTNEQDMVLALDDRARPSGLQEGDFVTAVNGAAYGEDDATGVRPCWVTAADVRAGDRIELQWIRPGTGRMSGTSVALPPHSLPADLVGIDGVAASPAR